ncbi:MAG: hypothetical protein LIO96_04475 [Lachnospiraceae bacterium]|nr:hypothetical protein [Lachnospiraceae bacterium]
MSAIKQYDKVQLDDGREAVVAEVLGDGKAFIADIDIGGDYDTDTIYPEQIRKIIN